MSGGGHFRDMGYPPIPFHHLGIGHGIHTDLPVHELQGEPLQALAAAAADSEVVKAAQTGRPRKRSADGKFKPRIIPIQDRPRENGRFVSTCETTYHQLTEALIRPMMRYCKITAAEMLKCSMYQLRVACKTLDLKWPRTPEVPTPEHHKAMNRKKRKERIPKNSTPFFYCEKEDPTCTRFHELRISSNGRDVFTRFGRTDLKNYDWKANKRTRFAEPDEAHKYCHAQKAEFWGVENWIEKTMPALPKNKPKSKLKAKELLQTKRKSVKELLVQLEDMREDNRVTPGSHAPEEVEMALERLDAMRSKMHSMVRQSKGLVEATKEQRQKVKDMKVANLEKPDTYTEQDIHTESHKLRELMCKYSKRTMIPKGELRLQAAAKAKFRSSFNPMNAVNTVSPGTYGGKSATNLANQNLEDSRLDYSAPVDVMQAALGFSEYTHAMPQSQHQRLQQNYTAQNYPANHSEGDQQHASRGNDGSCKHACPPPSLPPIDSVDTPLSASVLVGGEDYGGMLQCMLPSAMPNLLPPYTEPVGGMKRGRGRGRGAGGAQRASKPRKKAGEMGDDGLGLLALAVGAALGTDNNPTTGSSHRSAGPRKTPAHTHTYIAVEERDPAEVHQLRTKGRLGVDAEGQGFKEYLTVDHIRCHLCAVVCTEYVC